MKNHAAPLIVAIVVLLLPVLYVGSYFALVVPNGITIGTIKINYVPYPLIDHYRAGGDFSATIFWPLEQIDRKVRPGAWGSEVLPTGGGSLAPERQYPVP